jgi:hypothetical protein
MPLLQYFGWVGSFLIAALFATNWCCSAPTTRTSLPDVPLDRKINIRIHTDHKWPERVILDTTRATPVQDAEAHGETDVGESRAPVLAERQPFDAVQRWRPPQGRVFDHPAPPKLRSGNPRQLRKAPLQWLARRARVSLCPIGFASRQEEADAFAHESGQFAAQLFRAFPHQSPHYHRQ